MGKRRKQKVPQESVNVSMDHFTSKLVREWRRKGSNVSEMIRYCMKHTFPVQLNTNDQVKRLKAALEYKAAKFEDYRIQFEDEAGKIQAKIRKIEEAEKENVEET